MAEDRREKPHTRTSAPVAPARTTKDAPAPGRDEQAPRRASDEGEVRGDRMPAGAEEPGAGL